MSARTQPARLARDQITRAYTRLARKYDVWARLTESRARQRCLEAAAIRNGESVLEVAAGTGILFAMLLERNPDGRTEGIDLTEGMLERARTKAEVTGASNYRLAVGDAHELEYEKDQFDVLINNYMFDLLPETSFLRVLTEFKRVLRPRGRLVLANMTTPSHWYQGLWELLYRLSPALMGGCRGVELADYVAAAGFTGVRRESVSQLTFPSEVVTGVKPE